MDLIAVFVEFIGNNGDWATGWVLAALLWRKTEVLTERLIKNHEGMEKLAQAVISNTDTMKLLVGLINDKK